MSANVQTMAYVGEKPWHGLGKEVKKAMTASEALKEAGLDWTVEKKQVCYEHKGKVMTAEGQYVVARKDNGHALGIVGSVYTPIQNVDCFSFFDAVVQDKEAIYHTAGALGGGERVWILAKLPGHIKVTNEDIVGKYVLLANSHNGHSPLQMLITPIRVVCQNTLNAALKGDKFNARHTLNIGSKVEDCRKQLGIVNTWFQEFENLTTHLVAEKVTKNYLDGFLSKMGFDKETAVGRGQRDSVTALFEHGKGNDLKTIKGTKWALFNAVTEYTDHERSTRVTNGFKSEQEARLNSQWFGSGATLKQKALDELVMVR